MRSSYFKGWVSTLPNMPLGQPANAGMQIVIGHVLKVQYEGPNAGEITVKIIDIDRKSDDEITRTARPADANIVKYPLPGEIVLMFAAYANYQYKDKLEARLYYISSITSSDSITFNSSPFFSTYESRLTAESVITPFYKTRFERKMINLESFKQTIGDNTIKQRNNLRPFEGDFIIQSRFGSTIRLGSTGINEKSSLTQYNNSWSKNGGISGNPITIFRTNRGVEGKQVVEDVNKDDSSIYMCTTQIIPITLSTSKDLKSYKYVYNVTAGDAITASPDSTSFIETPEEEVQYQQVIELFDKFGLIPDVDVSSVKSVIDSIPDSALDPLVSGTPRDNNQRLLDLVLVDGYFFERNAAKALLAMKKAAKDSSITLQVTSGWRPQFGIGATYKTKSGKTITPTSQEKLRKDTSYWIPSQRSKYASDNDYVFQAPSTAFSPPVATPGSSKHGDGVAVDLKTGSRKHTAKFGQLRPTEYTWLIKNAHKFGFVRTVSSEEWHFEFRPNLAANGPYGGISMAQKDKATRDKYLFYQDLNLHTLA